MQKSTRFSLYFILLNTITCCYFFYPILFSLNKVLLSWGGDGLKNYYNYLYFVKYNYGTSFFGMNYPFGENIVFTDNMPVLAWTLAKLKILFPIVPDYALFFMHGMMMLSYPLAAVFIYKILKLFKVEGWWAIISAVFIAYFSPQFLRLGGHFSLSLACCIPMIIYWTMQYQRKKSIKYLLFLYLGITFFTFCHVYFLAIALIFLLSFFVSNFLTLRAKFKTRLLQSLPPFLSAVAAIATFKLFLYLTDIVTDRPKYPIGFLNATTTFKDILTTAYNFLGANIFSIFFDGPSFGSEGYTYIGIITSLVLLVVIYRIIKSLLFRFARKPLVPTHPVRAYRVWLLTATLCLLFAMGVPFIWGLQSLADYLSILRQFRSIGRFSWIFYYLITIYSAIVLYRYWQCYRKKNKWQKLLRIMPLLITVVYFIEFNGYAQHLHELYGSGKEHYNSYFTKGEANWNNHMNAIGHSPKNYQSCLILPYFHIGSEQLGLQNNGEGYSLLYGSQFCFQTGLPMTDVMMSRTSWSQTYEQVELIDGPFSPKTILSRFNKKPVLVLVNQYEQLLPGESWLVDHTKQIGDWAGFRIYEMNIDNFLSEKKQYEDSLIEIIKKDSRQFGLLENKNAYSYNAHFEDQKLKDAFIGEGSYMPTENTSKQEMITVPVSHPTNNDTLFIFSAWLKCIPYAKEMPYIFYEGYDSNNNKILDGDFLTGHSTYKIGNWFKAERVIKVNLEVKYIKFYSIEATKNQASIDELLIRPLNTNYFYKVNADLFLINNRPVKLN